MRGLVSGVMSSRGVRRGGAAESATRSEGILRLSRDRQSVARQSGVTLIQMLVTVTVIGLLLAAASPNVASLLSVYPIRSGARQIYAELESARMAAVTENTSYRFSVCTGGISYIVYVYTGVVSDCTLQTPRPLDAASQGVSMAASSDIVFSSNGGASTTGTVTMTNNQGTSMQVAVGTAGRIRIQ